MNRTTKDTLVPISLLFFTIVSLFLFLGRGHIFQVSEAREGVVVNEILFSGNYILPLRNGEIVPSKPPLFHWLGASVAKVTGTYMEFELRLPSAVAATLLVMALYFFASSATNKQIGLSASLVLLTSYGFFRLATDGRVDMVFVCLVSVAIFYWIHEAGKVINSGNGLERIPKHTYYLVAALTGSAILAKGPLGLVLVLLVLVSIAFNEHKLIGAKQVLLQPAWVLTFLLSAPWYLLASQVGDEAFVKRQIIFENISRFFGGKGISEKPPWFYVEHFWKQAAPWSLVFAIFILALLIEIFRRRSPKTLLKSYYPSEKRSAWTFRAMLIWFFVIFIFMSLSSGKRRAYLLTILPAYAFLVSCILHATWRKLKALLEDSQLYSSKLKWLGYTFWALLPISFFVIHVFPHYFDIAELTTKYKSLVTLDAWKIVLAGKVGIEGVIIILWLVCGMKLWHQGFDRRRAVYLFLSFCLFVNAVFLVFVNYGLILKGVTHSYRNFSYEIIDIVPKETKINFVKKIKDESFDGFFFYFRRHVHMHNPKDPLHEAGLYLARRVWLDKQPLEKISNIQEIHVGGRRIDREEDKLVLFRYVPNDSFTKTGIYQGMRSVNNQ